MTDAVNRIWDVVIIGAGMGGGMAGRALAEQGFSVLFVEKGRAGYRTERQDLNLEMFVPEARRARGYWPDPVVARIDGRVSEFYAPLGSGIGGSSVFYAATLERPERHDLEDTSGRPHPTNGWPIGFDDMRPWYDEAEKLLHVCGTHDPLSSEPDPNMLTPPPPGEGDAVFAAEFEKAGLHPYRLHSAIKYKEGCLDCLGRKCPRRCKMDGRSAGVEPAIETGNAMVLTDCEVEAIRGADGQVSHIEAIRDGAPITIRARAYVLAAGALASPHLLLSSTCDAWPNGFANSNDQVGRNLMFHLNEMIAIWPPKSARFDGASKTISIRDLYHANGQRFGTIQAMGIDLRYGEILHYLRGMLQRSALPNWRILRELARVPAWVALRMLGEAKVFVGLMEDLPYPENRVRIEPKNPRQLVFDYHFNDELKQRRKSFRRHMKKALKGMRSMFLGIQPELNFGHPCGTLRFGCDPATSVCDPDCRAHEARNLFIADASFMPTSMGVNPSLTIAANALRVAHIIAADLKEPARD